MLSVEDTAEVVDTPQEDVDIQQSAETPQDNTLQKTDTETLKTNESSTPAKETPTITTKTVKGKAGKKITLTATVKNSTGPIKGVKVTFTLNGKTYKATTNANGVASLKVKCPSTAVTKITKKTKGKKMTETTTYSKTYSAKAALDDGTSSTFKVISTKNKVVKKYKIIKKKKTVTVKFKKGTKTFKKGKYAIITSAKTENGYTYFGAAVVGKQEQDYIKFFIKEHYKYNGKWKWES